MEQTYDTGNTKNELKHLYLNYTDEGDKIWILAWTMLAVVQYCFWIRRTLQGSYV